MEMVLTMKQARHLAGKTQQEIADMMGIHVNTYRDYEKNPDKMTVRQTRDFCAAVNVKMSDISFGLEWS